MQAGGHHVFDESNFFAWCLDPLVSSAIRMSRGGKDDDAVAGAEFAILKWHNAVWAVGAEINVITTVSAYSGQLASQLRIAAGPPFVGVNLVEIADP